MTRKEALQALLNGKKVRDITWENKKAFIRFDDETDAIVDNRHGRNNIIMMVDTIWEIYHEPILDEEEKKYLKTIIRPYRKTRKTIYITKFQESQRPMQWIEIDCDDGIISFPSFKENTMYKGMELLKRYTLEELGL